MPKILIISNVPWNGLKQRPHFIAELLGEKYDVIFFEPPGPFPKRLISKNVIKRKAKRILVLQNNRLMPFRPIFSNLNFVNINRILNEKFIKHFLNSIDDYVIITENYLYFDYVRLRKLIRVKKIVYDCVDLLECFDLHNKKFRLFFEKQLIEIADKIIVVSGELEEKFRNFRNKVIRISNGVDFCKFQKAMDIEKENIKKVVRRGYNNVLGYIGAVEEWFDFKVINKILERYLDTRIVLIGIIGKKVLKKYYDLNSKFGERMEYVGYIHHDKLPFYIKYIDFGLIPFDLQHPVVKGINPIKLQEYFAMGKSVIANVWGELLPFHDNIKLIDFETYLEKKCEIEKSIGQEAFNEKISIAQSNNWSSKIQEIINLIER